MEYIIKTFTGDVDRNGRYTNATLLNTESFGEDKEAAWKDLQATRDEAFADCGEYVEISMWQVDKDGEEEQLLSTSIEHKYRRLEDAVVVYWSWQTHVGYARRFHDVEVYYGSGTEQLTIEEDKSFTEQMTVIAWPEDLVGMDDEEKREYILNTIMDMNKWQNPNEIETRVNDLF